MTANGGGYGIQYARPLLLTMISRIIVRTIMRRSRPSDQLSM